MAQSESNARPLLESSEEPTKVFVRVEDIFEFEEMNL